MKSFISRIICQNSSNCSDTSSRYCNTEQDCKRLQIFPSPLTEDVKCSKVLVIFVRIQRYRYEMETYISGVVESQVTIKSRNSIHILLVKVKVSDFQILL